MLIEKNTKIIKEAEEFERLKKDLRLRNCLCEETTVKPRAK